MRVDGSSMSPATLNMYVDWIMTERLQIPEDEYKNYTKLIQILLDLEFIWIHPRDENRAGDGLALRDDFTYETGLYLDGSSGLMPKCTVFEMLAALAYRCESQLMLDYSVGYRGARWWYLMLENLDLDQCTDNRWRRDDDAYVRDVIHKFMNRDYKANGEGGLFPIKTRGINQRTEEIWKQLMAYLNENYV